MLFIFTTSSVWCSCFYVHLVDETGIKDLDIDYTAAKQLSYWAANKAVALNHFLYFIRKKKSCFMFCLFSKHCSFSPFLLNL